MTCPHCKASGSMVEKIDQEKWFCNVCARVFTLPKA